MSFEDALLIELIRAAVSLTVLALGWLVGQRILVSWDIRKKRMELDLATSGEFNALYGEFKEVSKLWRIIKRKLPGSLEYPSDTRWSLLARACGSESRSEAIIVKLASERKLVQEEIWTLGLFRQAVQQLREAIRDDKEVASSSRGAEYVLFNRLAAGVAAMIRRGRAQPSMSPDATAKTLQAITDVDLDDYRKAVTEVTEGLQKPLLPK